MADIDNLDIESDSGYINIEIVTDGGINIFCRPNDDMHLKLNKQQTIELAKWIVARINVGIME